MNPTGGRAEWETAKQIFLKPPTPSARTHAIYALTRTEDEELVHETFKFMMNEVKSQDLMYFFVGFNNNRKTRRQLFTFFKDNYDEVGPSPTNDATDINTFVVL